MSEANALLDRPRGTTEAERQAIINYATQGVEQKERGDIQAVRQTLARQGLLGSGFELAEEVEAMGTSFSSLVDRDGFGLGSTCLGRLQADAVSLLGEVIAEPAFDRAQFDMAKSDVDGEIGETEDHPHRRAVLELLPLLFPSTRSCAFRRRLRPGDGALQRLAHRGGRLEVHVRDPEREHVLGIDRPLLPASLAQQRDIEIVESGGSSYSGVKSTSA